jgi:hypothetical protein
VLCANRTNGPRMPSASAALPPNNAPFYTSACAHPCVRARTSTLDLPSPGVLSLNATTDERTMISVSGGVGSLYDTCPQCVTTASLQHHRQVMVYWAQASVHEPRRWADGVGPCVLMDHINGHLACMHPQCSRRALAVGCTHQHGSRQGEGRLGQERTVHERHSCRPVAMAVLHSNSRECRM